MHSERKISDVNFNDSVKYLESHVQIFNKNPIKSIVNISQIYWVNLDLGRKPKCTGTYQKVTDLLM